MRKSAIERHQWKSIEAIKCRYITREIAATASGEMAFITMLAIRIERLLIIMAIIDTAVVLEAISKQ